MLGGAENKSDYTLFILKSERYITVAKKLGWSSVLTSLEWNGW